MTQNFKVMKERGIKMIFNTEAFAFVCIEQIRNIVKYLFRYYKVRKVEINIEEQKFYYDLTIEIFSTRLDI